MTPLEAQLYARLARRIATMSPDMRAAMLRAWQIIRDALSDAEIAKVVESGNADTLFSEVLTDVLFDQAAFDLRQRIRRVADRSFQYATNDLPRGGMVNGVLAVRFDYLSPRVITALRALETDAINTLKGDVKETTRAFLENALRNGTAPKTVARELRAIIGLAPNQERYIENLRSELTEGRFADAERRVLLDRRFNLAKLNDLTPAARAQRIETIVSAYRKRYIAFNANTNAKTHTLSAYKAGQRLAWQEAKANGAVPEGSIVTKTWIHLDPQPDPRPEHQTMNHQTVPMEQPYSNGDQWAGESDPWNCHCLDRYGVRAA